MKTQLFAPDIDNIIDPAAARLHRVVLQVNKYQFWRHDNKPIEFWSNRVIDEKID